jgi:hypothetical protein
MYLWLTIFDLIYHFAFKWNPVASVEMLRGEKFEVYLNTQFVSRESRKNHFYFEECGKYQ